jgi:hypothetical protein
MRQNHADDNHELIAIDIESLSVVTGGGTDTNGNYVPVPQPVPFSTYDIPGKVTQSVPGRNR